MAIHTDPKMYSGGAVVFNSQPEVNLYGQLLAKREAKNNAIDEYYRKLPSTINTAGLRDQDRAGFDQKIADWQKYWMDNKEKVRKGNTQEAFNSEKMLRDIQTGVQDSKNAAKTDLELGKMRFTGTHEYIFDDPAFMEAQHQHTIPVWDANHKSLDLGTIAIPPKPLDAEAQNKIWGVVTNGVKAAGKEYDESKQKTNPVTMLTAVPYVKRFKPEQVVGIAENMGRLVNTDKSVFAHYNKMLNTLDEGTLNKLQQAYSSVYPGQKLQGKNGTMIVPDLMDSPEKLAKAEAIVKASVPQEEGEDYRPDKAAVMDRTEKFKIDQQERSHQNAQSNIRLAYGFRAIEGEKLEETSDRAIERDKDYAKTHNGNLDMPPAKMKLLFGETGGTATINSNGDYVRKHGDKEDVLPASEAKTKLMVQGKPGYVPGVKGATNSKPTTGGTHKVVIKKGELD